MSSLSSLLSLALALGSAAPAHAQAGGLGAQGIPPPKSPPKSSSSKGSSGGRPAKKPAAKPSPGSPGAPRPGQPRRPRAPGVRGMFDVGQELFEAGKYNEAAVAYDALLRKYPGHEPAMIQLAKSFYRLDRIRDAYTVFSRLSPAHLDPETSYEFGWSFYQNKAWEGALYAFQRVPRGHALYDLANYYGSICAIKLKKYDEAEDMLEKAVVLPDKLAKSRALYIKHVQALRLMQQKSELAKERKSEKDALGGGGDAKKNGKRDPAAAKDPGKYEHKGAKSVRTAATVAAGVEHQYIDNHGLKQTSYDARIATAELAGGPLIPIPVKIKDRQAAVGLELSLKGQERITEGQEQRQLIDETNDDLARVLNQDLETTDVKYGNVTGVVWAEFPLPEETWFALTGEIFFTYPEFERGARTGYRKGGAGMTGAAGPVNWSGDLSYTEILDTETEPTQTIVGGALGASGDLMPKMTLEATAGHDVYDYLIEDLGLDGPDSVTSGSLTLSQGLPWEFGVSAMAAVEHQTNYITHGVPTFGQVSADAMVYSGKAALTAKPVKWFSLKVSQLFSKTNWTIDNEEATDQFELTAADYVETFNATATLSLLF